METRTATWEYALEAPGIINLGIGQPHEPLLPLALLQDAATSVLTDKAALDARHVLQYSAGLGTGPFLESLASFLTEQYGYPVAADSLCTTNGNSQAIDLCCQTFAKPGDKVLIEEPTYFLVHDIIRDSHLEPLPVPQLPGGGLDMAVLKRLLGEHKPSLLYTIPVFNNPMGTTHGDAQRRELVELAVQHNFKIVADEVYQLLPFGKEATPPNSYAWYASQAGAPGAALSLNTFSKILSPGLRLGWIESSPENVEAFASRGVIVSGGGLNPFTASLVQHLLDNGSLSQHIEWVKAEYSARCSALVDAINSGANGFEVVNPNGGYFIWMRLPPGCDASRLLEAARQRGVAFHPGTVTSLTQDAALGSYIRLSFAFYSTEDMAKAGRCLAQCINDGGGRRTTSL